MSLVAVVRASGSDDRCRKFSSTARLAEYGSGNDEEERSRFHPTGVLTDSLAKRCATEATWPSASFRRANLRGNRSVSLCAISSLGVRPSMASTISRST